MKRSFVTEEGIEVPAVTPAGMREIDRLAVEETGPSLLQMMENAGRGLAERALGLLGSGWLKARVVVLAGSRGNGGGGICAARHLANRGVDVSLVLARPEGLSEAAAFQRRIFAFTPGRELGAASVEGERPDLVLDALLGYGLVGPPRPPVAELIDWANGQGGPILALDVPSGLDAATGDLPGASIRAHTTLTLALPKTGLDSPQVGELWLADLGIPPAVFVRSGHPYVDPFGSRWQVRLRRRAVCAAADHHPAPRAFLFLGPGLLFPMGRIVGAHPSRTHRPSGRGRFDLPGAKKNPRT